MTANPFACPDCGYVWPVISLAQSCRHDPNRTNR
jgi:predicted RNA-binding Zn-ribbon protein involved in translation (DUF1610 family)